MKPMKKATNRKLIRIDQTQDVFVHLPVSLHPEFDSFDVNLDRLLCSKLMLKDAVVTSDVVTEAEMVKSMGLRDEEFEPKLCSYGSRVVLWRMTKYE